MRAPVSTMPVPGKAGPGRGDGDVTPAVFLCGRESSVDLLSLGPIFFCSDSEGRIERAFRLPSIRVGSPRGL